MVGVGGHELAEPRVARGLRAIGTAEPQGMLRHLVGGRGGRTVRGGVDEFRTDGELEREILAGLLAPAEIPQPRGERVDARRHDVLPEPDAIDGERGLPQVVADTRQRLDRPLARLAVPHVQPAVELVMAVAHDVRLHQHAVAHESLDREPTTVHLGADAVDRHATPQVRGQLTRFVEHGRRSLRGGRAEGVEPEEDRSCGRSRPIGSHCGHGGVCPSAWTIWPPAGITMPCWHGSHGTVAAVGTTAGIATGAAPAGAYTGAGAGITGIETAGCCSASGTGGCGYTAGASGGA